MQLQAVRVAVLIGGGLWGGWRFESLYGCIGQHVGINPVGIFHTNKYTNNCAWFGAGYVGLRWAIKNPRTLWLLGLVGYVG